MSTAEAVSKQGPSGGVQTEGDAESCTLAERGARSFWQPLCACALHTCSLLPLSRHLLEQSEQSLRLGRLLSLGRHPRALPRRPAGTQALENHACSQGAASGHLRSAAAPPPRCAARLHHQSLRRLPARVSSQGAVQGVCCRRHPQPCKQLSHPRPGPASSGCRQASCETLPAPSVLVTPPAAG